MSEESTTPDPVELTRQSIEAWSRGDIEAAMSLYASDAAWDLDDIGVGTFEGVAAIRGFRGEWAANWEDYLAEVEEIRDLGHGVVFVAYREDGRPVGSEGRVQQRRGAVAVIVEGLISGATFYSDIDDARAAAERLAEKRAQADV